MQPCLLAFRCERELNKRRVSIGGLLARREVPAEREETWSIEAFDADCDADLAGTTAVDPRERAGATLPCIQLDSVAELGVDVFRFCENAPDNLEIGRAHV